MAATYCNTDLEIRSRFDPARLVASLDRADLFQLGEVTRRGSVWRVAFEVGDHRWMRDPARTISRLLDVVEGFPVADRELWDRCLDRRFDIGFEYTGSSFSSMWKIDGALVRRLAAVNASVAITIYRPDGGVPE